jgi:hypothetical protein
MMADAVDHAKAAMIASATYLAAKNPKGAARAAVRIAAHYAIQVWTDTKAISRILGEELLAPEAAEAKASARPLAGSMVVISPWIPLALFGSHLVNAIDDLNLTSTGSNQLLGLDTGAAGV